MNISKTEQEELHQTIYNPDYGIKSNAAKRPLKPRKVIEKSIRSLKEKGAELIVLGCTELPLVFDESYFESLPVIDPSVVMARALIYAHSQEKLKTWIKKP